MSATETQLQLCQRYGAPYHAPDLDLKCGIALATLGREPLNGLRHPPESGTSGWFFWGGEFSTAPDFFSPLHLRHLADRAPQAIVFLGLPPGWRFLIDRAGVHDVWHDPELLRI